MTHPRGLSRTLVSLQVSHSSRTRACDLKINLHAILSPTPLANSMPLTAPPREKTGRKLKVGDALTPERTVCQKVCSFSLHWRKLYHRFQKLWHMLSAFHRPSAEGLSDHVHFKSRSSTSTSLRPTMFFFCHGWLVPTTASKHETSLWETAHSTEWLIQSLILEVFSTYNFQWSPQHSFHYCACKCLASAY